MSFKVARRTSENSPRASNSFARRSMRRDRLASFVSRSPASDSLILSRSPGLVLGRNARFLAGKILMRETRKMAVEPVGHRLLLAQDLAADGRALVITH